MNADESDSWWRINILDLQKYVKGHPECVTTFKPCVDWVYGSAKARCTLVGRALTPGSIVLHHTVTTLLDRVSVDEICYVCGEKDVRIDVLSCAVLARRYVDHILTTKRLTSASLQNAIAFCDYKRAELRTRVLINKREFEERIRPYEVSKQRLQARLDQQSTVFAATVWSFRQAFVGDHQTVFDTLAEVWRNGFYYHF